MIRTQRKSTLLIPLLIIFIVAACARSQEQSAKYPEGAFPVDTLFKRFHEKLGGAEIIGYAISPIFDFNGVLCEAGFLFGLFWIQFILGALVPPEYQAIERIGVGIVYLILGTWLVVGNWHAVPRLFHDGLRAPYAELTRHPSRPVTDVHDID